MAEHSTLTGADLHEPKGISSATAGTTYVADGSGSGTWANPTSVVKNANIMPLTTQFTNISGGASSCWVVSPISGKITGIQIVLNNGITVANAAITVKINGVLVTNSTITVTQAGSVAGSVFASTPTANNTVAALGPIQILSDGASTTACTATVTILMNTA